VGLLRAGSESEERDSLLPAKAEHLATGGQDLDLWQVRSNISVIGTGGDQVFAVSSTRRRVRIGNTPRTSVSASCPALLVAQSGSDGLRNEGRLGERRLTPPARRRAESRAKLRQPPVRPNRSCRSRPNLSGSGRSSPDSKSFTSPSLLRVQRNWRSVGAGCWANGKGS